MANYRSILDVESVEQATEYMNVLVEDAGSLKKVPAGGMIGGSGGSNVAIWRDEYFLNVMNGVVPSVSYQEINFTPVNMTFEEALEIFESGEALSIIAQEATISDNPLSHFPKEIELRFANGGANKYLMVAFYSFDTYFWSEYGITLNEPYGAV